MLKQIVFKASMTRSYLLSPLQSSHIEVSTARVTVPVFSFEVNT